MLTIVGDVFARPLLAALDAEPDRWDLSSLRAITSSGVHVEPRGEARPARPPPRRHHRRLARRVGGAMGPRQSARAGDARISPGPVRGERPHPGGRRGDGARRRARHRRGRYARRRRPDPARLLQGSREDARPPSARSTASATRSPATTPRSTPTAPSGCSGAARRASTRAARRSTPRRSRPSCASTRGVFDCVVRGRPRRALRRARGRAGAGHRRRRPRRGRDGRRGAAPAWRGTRPRAASCSSTRSSARRRARPTTASCARSRSSCSPTTPRAPEASAPGAAQAPRASGAVQRSGAGEPPRCCGPSSTTRSRPLRLAS